MECSAPRPEIVLSLNVSQDQPKQRNYEGCVQRGQHYFEGEHRISSIFTENCDIYCIIPLNVTARCCFRLFQIFCCAGEFWWYFSDTSAVVPQLLTLTFVQVPRHLNRCKATNHPENLKVTAGEGQIMDLLRLAICKVAITRFYKILQG
mmetsp:Transcript_52869/g.105966  ORF Transcript_52869/g.105966 Transcript_52869/m.105966 type:complete len:149 (-) Transcript_52869:3-449(-)